MKLPLDVDGTDRGVVGGAAAHGAGARTSSAAASGGHRAHGICIGVVTAAHSLCTCADSHAADHTATAGAHVVAAARKSRAAVTA